MKDTKPSTKKHQEGYRQAQKNEAMRLLKEDTILGELQHAATSICENIDSLRTVLKQHYNMNVVYSTYRNMIAVTQLMEYIESGVASTLEGSHGAYAQYLQDIRANRICSKLDDISRQLDLITQNQTKLATLLSNIVKIVGEIDETLGQNLKTVQNIESKLSGMEHSMFEANEYLKLVLPELNRIADSTHITAFNSKVIALNDYRQAEISSWRLEYPQND